MKSRLGFTVLLSALAAVGPAQSGHELPVYPSYYPHEIEIRTVGPDAAGHLLPQSRIQAYLGNEPDFRGTAPDVLGTVQSLGSLVTVRVNPQSAYAKDQVSACAAVRAVARTIHANSPDVILHPYPVTPLHGDYLHHVDLAEAAKARLLSDKQVEPAIRTLKAKAVDTPASEWDVEIRQIALSDLMAGATTVVDGWLLPPAARSGWYQAWLVLRDALDAGARERLSADVQRLRSNDVSDRVDRFNLERAVVTALVGDCRQVVIGYTLRREYFNTEFSAGIENIGFDSLTGLDSATFIRTVKLKDFPWNGWLYLGIDAQPRSAWNPITGFSDSFGQLLWSAVADPGLLPQPYDAAWMANRISAIETAPSR
jgi:hypothetical protein